MSPRQGFGLGRDSDPIDSMQIKHVRGAMINDARYETAPILPAMSAQNNFFNVPPPLSSPTKLTSPAHNGVAGHSMPEPQVSLRRDNSLTLRDPGSMMTHQTTMQPSASKFYQTQLSQFSREHDLILVGFPLSLVVNLPREGVRLGRVFTGSVGEGVVKLGQVEGPPGLATVQSLGHPKVCEIPVVI